MEVASGQLRVDSEQRKIQNLHLSLIDSRLNLRELNRSISIGIGSVGIGGNFRSREMVKVGGLRV
jgi:hypothetical protein